MTDGLSVFAYPERAGHFIVQSQIWVPQPRDDVFAFFADAHNLQELTPEFLNFEIITPAPIAMAEGALIDYRIKLRGVPMRWRTEISLWDPPHAFEDRQLRGPYTTWEHRHTFVAEERGGVMGTLVRDAVVYRPPFGRFANWLLVERDVRRIFAYRQERMQDLFDRPISDRAA